MGLFDGIGEARSRNSSEWAAAGHYICRIDKVKVSQTRKDETGFFIEMTVLHVLQKAPGEFEAKTHRPGDSITHMISKKFPDTFLPNIKGFVASVMGMSPDGITPENVEAIVAEEGPSAQPLSGWTIEYKGRMIKTKRGNDFTEISYRGVVQAERLKEILSEQIIETYFDGGRVLEELIEWEASQG